MGATATCSLAVVRSAPNGVGQAVVTFGGVILLAIFVAVHRIQPSVHNVVLAKRRGLLGWVVVGALSLANWGSAGRSTPAGDAAAQAHRRGPLDNKASWQRGGALNQVALLLFVGLAASAVVRAARSQRTAACPPRPASGPPPAAR